MMYLTEETLVLNPHFQQFPTPMLFIAVCGKLHVCNRIDITVYRLSKLPSTPRVQMWKWCVWNWQLIDSLLIVCQKQIAILQEEEMLFPETCRVSLLCYLSLHNNYSIWWFANLWNNLTEKIWTPQRQVAKDCNSKRKNRVFFLIVRN